MNYKRYICLASLFGLSSMNVSAEFIGKLVLEPREKPRYEVMEDFSYKDRLGRVWTTTKGYQTDGASIPKLLWPVIGDPYGGGYIKSAVIHDQACDERKRTWQETHQVFFDAMIEEGVNPTRAYVMYAAVYKYGPRWKVNILSSDIQPTLEMSRSICLNCAPISTLTIDRKVTISEKPLEFPKNGVLTTDKLKSIELEVQKLEANGPVKLEDLEKLQIE